MPATYEHPNFRIVDDLLDEETWTALWSDFQFMDLHPVTRTRGAWKLDDGVPLGGEELVVPRSGAEDPGVAGPVARLIDAVLEHRDDLRGFVDDGWEQVSGRPYVYPRGAGLSWHVDDHQLYAGAFVYYAHPHWNAHWGGELLVAETESEGDQEQEEAPIMGYRFETESYSERLLEIGCGNFISPKPNRLVLLAGAPHMVSPVSAAAGASVRASVSGFFLRGPQGGEVRSHG